VEKKQMPIRFPVDLLNELDKYVGSGHKSKFIIEATRKELVKRKQLGAIKKAKGILKEEDYPEFSTSDDVADWVRKLREESDAKRRELFDVN